ncbi:acyl-CoA dehydrogenase family protein [Zavarzinia sp. CC-PAN008]|uniref:acyl-CoA dehydrogenase family protein n=1 Tax=Zavarzinia sp. CC-PAN008 TaxID=3243332 RepID=UPI003F74343C
MNLEFSIEDEAFRSSVRSFLEANLTPELRAVAARSTSVFTEKPDAIAWQKILAAKGWAAPTWPVEHGGTGWTSTQVYIFESELARAGAPSMIPMGLRMVSPVIMAFGTPEQKQKFLPPTLAGDLYWCQGYSEPGSGSDLAALSMRAVPDGDDYVINGSKIWTTHAHYADWIFALVRTDASGKPQTGITFLLIDMKTPGISIRPLITLAGDHEVNQVFFEDVRVPQGNRIGDEGKGWTYAKYLLEFERGGAYGARLQQATATLRRILESEAGPLGRLIDDPTFAARLAEVEIDVQGLTVTEHRVMAEISRTGRPGPESSLLKTRGTEVSQRITELGIEAIGSYAMPYERTEPGANEGAIGPDYAGRSMGTYLNTRAASIYGGSNEIQRNIMAKAVLGL